MVPRLSEPPAEIQCHGKSRSATSCQALPRIYGEGVRALIDDADPPDEDGWLTVTLTFDSFEAARSSVLGLGTAAEVLDPPELRDAVAGDGKRCGRFLSAGEERVMRNA